MGIDTVYEQDMQTAHIIQPAEEMAAIIQQFDNIVIVAHGSPDGDAIGATGAMGSLVKALGKRFVLYNATPLNLSAISLFINYLAMTNGKLATC